MIAQGLRKITDTSAFLFQNNEEEALRSWRDSLGTIYRHNASLSSGYIPQNETERALQKSIQELEMQCKERIDLLEALRESRRMAGLEAGKSTSGLRGKFGIGRNQTQSTEQSGGSIPSPGWIGDGTIPPLDYPDLSRPALPPRLQVQDAHRGSSTSSVPTLSRSGSSDKKKTLRPTLRGNKDKKSALEVKGPSARQAYGPAASQAAGLAWNHSAPRPLGPNMTQSSPGGEATRKCVDYRPRTETYAKRLEDSSVNLAAGAAAAASRRPGETDLGFEDPNIFPTSYRSPEAKDTSSIKSNSMLKPGAAASAYPAYRKEYLDSGSPSMSAPVTPQASRVMSNSTSQWHYESSPRDSSRKPRATARAPSSGPATTGQRNDRLHHSAGGSPAKQGDSQAKSPSGISLDEDQVDIDEFADEFSEQMRIDKGFCNIMRNLPKGVDRHAAGQILNDIVVRGDEVHWDDIAGLEGAKKALKEAVVYPFLRPDLFMGLREPARGMLLFGPPGTGKTMLARAVATESKSTFFAISATSLTSKWHGESEKLVRALFSLAKAMAPSIIFVDEIDSLLSSRQTGDHDATRRTKTQFLVEWSDLQRAAAGREQPGREKAEGDPSRVLVLGATNMPWDIDDAARRRFVRRQYIPLPEAEVRKLQLQKLLSHQKHELSEADLDALVKVTDGKSLASPVMKYNFPGTNVSSLRILRL